MFIKQFNSNIKFSNYFKSTHFRQNAIFVNYVYTVVCFAPPILLYYISNILLGSFTLFTDNVSPILYDE